MQRLSLLHTIFLLHIFFKMIMNIPCMLKNECAMGLQRGEKPCSTNVELFCREVKTPAFTGIGLESAYCDMETSAGGWTLVYSYGFTNYATFTAGSNAITPRPDWPASKNRNLASLRPCGLRTIAQKFLSNICGRSHHQSHMKTLSISWTRYTKGERKNPKFQTHFQFSCVSSFCSTTSQTPTLTSLSPRRRPWGPTITARCRTAAGLSSGTDFW